MTADSDEFIVIANPRHILRDFVESSFRPGSVDFMKIVIGSGPHIRFRRGTIVSTGADEADFGRETAMGNPVVHFEIGCRNQEATASFYTDLFGWSITSGGPAALISTGS